MNQANLIQQQYHQLQQNVMNQELDQLKQINMMNNTYNSNNNDSSSAVLYIKAPAGKLNLKVNFFPNQVGAVITAIYESCTFKHQINVGDRIVTINGYHKVAKFEDLSIGINEPVRIIGIMRGGDQEGGGKKQQKGIKRKITEPTLASIPNVPPKPMRPLTAYHIFFQLEREYLIQTNTSTAADAADTDKKEEEEKKDSPAKAKRQSKTSDPSPSEYYNGTLPTKYKDIKLSHDWYYAPGKRRKRAHRKVSHGFSFLELSKTIIEQWKALDTTSDDTDGIKEFVTKLAKQELEEYKVEIGKWRELYGDDKKKKKKTKKEKKEEERKAKEDAEKKATLVKVVNGEAYYVQAPAGKLGLAVKFVNDGNAGAVITAIYENCAFKNQVKVGDRIVMINGYHAVNSLIDLSVGMNEPIRILGITKGGGMGREIVRQEKDSGIYNARQVHIILCIGGAYKYYERLIQGEERIIQGLSIRGLRYVCECLININRYEY